MRWRPPQVRPSDYRVLFPDPRCRIFTRRERDWGVLRQHSARSASAVNGGVCGHVPRPLEVSARSRWTHKVEQELGMRRGGRLSEVFTPQPWHSTFFFFSSCRPFLSFSFYSGLSRQGSLFRDTRTSRPAIAHTHRPGASTMLFYVQVVSLFR